MLPGATLTGRGTRASAPGRERDGGPVRGWGAQRLGRHGWGRRLRDQGSLRLPRGYDGAPVVRAGEPLAPAQGAGDPREQGEPGEHADLPMRPARGSAPGKAGPGLSLRLREPQQGPGRAELPAAMTS